MATIAPCPECGTGTKAVMLIGGKCHFHRINPGVKVERSALVSKLKEKAAVKKTLNTWFNEMLEKAPERCENCGEMIFIPDPFPLKTKVCHILPKAHFKSIATNDDNAWYGCMSCHPEYDNGTASHRAQMPVASIVKERFKKFYKQIAKTELRRVDKWLLDSVK